MDPTVTAAIWAAGAALLVAVIGAVVTIFVSRYTAKKTALAALEVARLEQQWVTVREAAAMLTSEDTAAQALGIALLRRMSDAWRTDPDVRDYARSAISIAIERTVKRVQLEREGDADDSEAPSL